MQYASLHHHTTLSMQDGVGSVDEHFARSAELGMPAQAVTEHGNVSSHVPAERAAAKHGIKAIFGLEAYTHPEPNSRQKFHLTILAKNQTGYQNLMHIVSKSWAEGFYQYPTVSGRMLTDHHEGLIVLSGCSDSLLACSLLGGKTIDPADASYKAAQRVATNFRALFGRDYYLETQMFPELERTRAINGAYQRLSENHGIPLVATADVHYPHPEDNELQLLVHAIGRGAATVAKQAESWEYDIRLTHPTSDKQVIRKLRDAGLNKRYAGMALESTVEIAEKCNVVLPKAERFRFPLKRRDGRAVDLLWRKIKAGWKYRIAQGNTRLKALAEEYRAQLNMEMGLIVSKDFVDYFLMVSDDMVWAKKVGIVVGPGRGSAAASLVCYLLRITEIDPMLFPMNFYRFIDPDRDDAPDIDQDIDDERRWEIRDRSVRKYGADKVASVPTFMRWRGRAAIADVARVHQIPHDVAEMVKDKIIDRAEKDPRAWDTVEDSRAAFAEVAEAFEKYPALKLAARIEGNYKSMSTHAAGLIVSTQPIEGLAALYTREVDDEETGKKVRQSVISVDKRDAEWLNLMKMDYLGLSTLGMIRRAIEHAGVTLEQLYAVPIDDKKTLKAFRQGDVMGIFQFEGRTTRSIVKSLRPTSFMELAHIVSLSRPGPLNSGTTNEYIRIKKGETQRRSFHPVIDEITADTEGQIIYQEQIMSVLGRFGGMEPRNVMAVRRVIGKKLGEHEFNRYFDMFAEGAKREHGVSTEDARKVWDRLVTAAMYAFNVPHAVSYSMLAFWCMWLKVNHPVSFFLASLQKAKTERYQPLIRDAEAHSIRVRGVSLSESLADWSSPDSGEIRAGWQQVSGIGVSKAQKIIEAGPFAEPEDLIRVNGIGEKTLPPIMAEIDHPDPWGLKLEAKQFRSIRKFIDKNDSMPRPTHDLDSALDYAGKGVCVLGRVVAKSTVDVVERTRLKTGQTREEVLSGMTNPSLTRSASFLVSDDTGETLYVRISRTKYPRMRQGYLNARPGDFILAKGWKPERGSSMQADQVIVMAPD